MVTQDVAIESDGQFTTQNFYLDAGGSNKRVDAEIRMLMNEMIQNLVVFQ